MSCVKPSTLTSSEDFINKPFLPYFIHLFDQRYIFEPAFFCYLHDVYRLQHFYLINYSKLIEPRLRFSCILKHYKLFIYLNTANKHFQLYYYFPSPNSISTALLPKNNPAAVKHFIDSGLVPQNPALPINAMNNSVPKNF